MHQNSADQGAFGQAARKSGQSAATALLPAWEFLDSTWFDTLLRQASSITVLR